MNDGFQLKYDHFHFVIKTFIKLLLFFKFIYSIFMTLLSNHFYPGFYFLRKLLCKLLVDAAAGYGLPPSQSFYFFTPGIQTFVLP